MHTRKLELTLCDRDREPGAPCVYSTVDCNCKSKTIHNSLVYLMISEGGINCNESFSYTGVCGGYGAYMNNMESYDGLDFGRDYCLSGEFSLRHPGKSRDGKRTRNSQEKRIKTILDIGNARAVRRWH